MRSVPFMILALLAGTIFTSSSVSAAPKWAKSGDTIVKCRGIAKKGANDCGGNGHDCAGKALKDNDPKEWVFVPKGVCQKIAGGITYKTQNVN